MANKKYKQAVTVKTRADLATSILTAFAIVSIVSVASAAVLAMNSIWQQHSKPAKTHQMNGDEENCVDDDNGVTWCLADSNFYVGTLEKAESNNNADCNFLDKICELGDKANCIIGKWKFLSGEWKKEWVLHEKNSNVVELELELEYCKWGVGKKYEPTLDFGNPGVKVQFTCEF